MKRPKTGKEQEVGASPSSRFMGGAVAQSVERATPGEEVPGSIPAVAARSLLAGSCQYNHNVTG